MSKHNFCSLCEENCFNLAFVNCGHVICDSCFLQLHSSSFVSRRCPFCRKSDKVIKLFGSDIVPSNEPLAFIWAPSPQPLEQEAILVDENLVPEQEVIEVPPEPEAIVLPEPEVIEVPPEPEVIEVPEPEVPEVTLSDSDSETLLDTDTDSDDSVSEPPPPSRMEFRTLTRVNVSRTFELMMLRRENSTLRKQIDNLVQKLCDSKLKEKKLRVIESMFKPSSFREKLILKQLDFSIALGSRKVKRLLENVKKSRKTLRGLKQRVDNLQTLLLINNNF